MFRLLESICLNIKILKALKPLIGYLKVLRS